MKLDKIKFARLIGIITHIVNRTLNEDEIDVFNHIIDFDVQETKASCMHVDELLKQMINPDGFINAIKAYRTLTGAGLRESKEAIEKYRNRFSADVPDGQEATLGDILNHATGRTKAGNNIG
jgi:ribosomal protein L7/L12